MPSNDPKSSPSAAVPERLNTMSEQDFDIALASALAESAGGGSSHVLLELDVVRADDIEHRFGAAAATAIRELLAVKLDSVLGSTAPTCEAGHCGLVALLKDVSCQQASEIAHRIRACVEDSSFSWHEHPFRLGSHIGVVQLGPSPMGPAAWRGFSRDVSVYALELGGDGVQVLEFGEPALAHLRGEKDWHEHISSIIA